MPNLAHYSIYTEECVIPMSNLLYTFCTSFRFHRRRPQSRRSQFSQVSPVFTPTSSSPAPRQRSPSPIQAFPSTLQLPFTSSFKPMCTSRACTSQSSALPVNVLRPVPPLTPFILASHRPFHPPPTTVKASPELQPTHSVPSSQVTSSPAPARQ